MLLQRLIAFGCLGILVEVLFTGVHSLLIKKDLRAPSRTYLWMMPIYGLGGAVLEYANEINASSSIWWRGWISTLLIFMIEFLCGGLLQILIGKCPWKYLDPINENVVHKLSVMGLIRIDYAPYWYILAVLFDYSSGTIQAVLNGASRI